MTEFEVFAGALDLEDPAERALFLQRCCDGDSALRRRVEELLRSNDRRDFLTLPAEGLTGAYTPGPPAAPPFPPGEQIGPYQLVRKLGEGGMGVVYEAVQVGLNRRVAVKMLRSVAGATGEEVQRFRLEAEAVAQLDHPNIIPVYEVGEAGEAKYFSMKLVEGGTSLAELLSKEADVRSVVTLLAAVARAVSYAHQRGIIHRDLKPDNVLISADGQPYVTDFGLAKRVAGGSHLTQTGAVMGTPSYMAPEQVAGQGAVTTAADVYALGAVLYEALTGRPPFRADSPVETLMLVLEGDVKRPRAENPAADADLEAVCMKCLARDPRSRYASAAELAADLEHWLAGEPLSVRPPNLATLARIWVRQNFGSGVWIVALGVLWGLFGGVLGLVGHWNPAWGRSEGVRGAVVLMLEFVGASIGLIAAVLIRPRNPAADLAAGLTTGLLAGVIAYTISWGWIAVVIAGLPYGIWIGMLYAMGILSFSGVYGTVVAGRLLRRHEQVRLVVLPYYELVIPAVVMVHMILGLMYRAFIQGLHRYAWLLLLSPVPALAILAAARQWHWGWRILLQGGWFVAVCVAVASARG